MKQEDLIKKLENLKTPDIEIQSHKQRLKMALLSFGYFKEKPIMFWTKRLVLAGVALALILAVGFVGFFTIIQPKLQIANAMEALAQNPQVRSVIEEYNLKVQEVVIKGDTAYIILDNVDRSNVIVTVDLDNGTVGRIVKDVKERNGDRTKAEAFEEKAAAKGISVEEFKKQLRERYEVKAESIGMTSEEFKGYLIEQKKTEAEAFEQKAEANGMTAEEYKTYLREQCEVKAESMGMTIGEFREYLGEQKKLNLKQK